MGCRRQGNEVRYDYPIKPNSDLCPLSFLLSMESPVAIESRLRAAQIILRPSQDIIDSPAPVKEWLHAFEARARSGDAHVSVSFLDQGGLCGLMYHIKAVVEELKKRLMQNVYELIPLVLISYKTLPISISDPLTLKDSPLILDLSCSQTLCAQARYLSSMPINEASTNHWSVLYNSLFSRAARVREIGLSLL